MLAKLWTTGLLFLAVVAAVVWLAALMREKDVRPVRDLARLFKRQTTAGRVLFGAFFAAMWVLASVKPGNRGAGAAPGFDAEDFERGFVLARVGTGETFDFTAASNAAVCADWESFGAAEDWIYANVGRGTGDETGLRIHSDGWAELLGRRVPTPPDVASGTTRPAMRFWPFKAVLGVVPAANWRMIEGSGEWGTGDGSRFWHFSTPSNTLQLTWQNALFDRLTNTPVSVQMEMCPNGRFTYRYDLSRCGGLGATALPDGTITNVLVGASLGALAWTTNSLPTNVTSLAFHPLVAEDAVNADRDGDGLPLFDELYAHGTDPDFWDTDRDGVSDGDEVASGTDPLARDTDADGFADATDVRPLDADGWTDADGDGLPDVWKDGWFGSNAVVAATGDANTNGVSNLASLMMGLNPVAPPPGGFAYAHGTSVAEVNAWEIVPAAFSFARPDALTNLVSRTFAVNRESPWEQYFVSASPDGAAGWEMADAALLYGLDGEPATNAAPSASGDSWRVPLGADMPQTVSFRVDATGGSPSLSAPLYLLRWTPRVEFLPSENVTVVAGTNGHVYAAAKRNPSTGAYEIPFRADVSRIPHFSGVDAEVAADLALPPADGVAVSGGPPASFTATDPLMADLPSEGTNNSKRLLFYSIDFSRTGAVASGPRASQYSSPYPLTSSSLRRSFHAATGVTADGSVELTLSPAVPELDFTTSPPPVRGGAPSRGTVSGGSKSGVVTPPATVMPSVCGEPCTNDFIELEHEYPADHDGTPGEDDGVEEVRPGGGEDDDCECGGDGGTSLGSFRIRIPFGESSADERLGYLWAAVDEPTAMTPATFKVLAARGVSVVTNANGTLSVSCSASGGKTLMVTNIPHGVAVPVWNASGRFESEWQVWNEDGDASRIRVRRMTVAGNATVDETFATWDDAAPETFGEPRGPATAWEKTDNLKGVTRTLWKWPDDADPDFVDEEHEETRLAGSLVRAEQRLYAMVGAGSTARRRLVQTYGYDEDGWHETTRTYWCDTDHPDRHARLRSVRSDRQPWVYTDYDGSGREIVRIEQLDGSPFPELADVSTGAPLPEWCSAKVTVTEYDPQDGDGGHRNDSFEPREVSVFVRRGGDAPILVSHETRIYTREADAGGVPLRRIVKTVGVGEATRTETAVEYPQDDEVPTYLRGLPVYTTAPDGSATATDYSLSNGCLVATARTSFNGVERETYRRTVADAAYRLPLREETRLSSSDAVLEWSERTYDDIRRLRSVAYSDGTSETNAYSCCRLLWRRDREGRKVLRSAQTGTDSLYYAEEAVWLADVGNGEWGTGNGATNGFRVTQHFFDGFGRETNTVTYAGTTPGEAVSPFHSSQLSQMSRKTANYHDDWHGGYSESTDERGAVTLRWRSASSSCESHGETILTNGADVLRTTTTAYRNGGTTTRREWAAPGGSQSPATSAWTEEHRFDEYDQSGRRVAYVVTESSDCGVVTNTVSTYDLLGRLVSSAVPCVTTTPSSSAFATTTYAYDGTSSRLLSSTCTAGDVVRTTTYLYNGLGERIGTVLYGVTNRTDIAYETDASNVVWKVETSSVVGPATNSITITRTQLTGLSASCRRHMVTLAGASVPLARTETIAAFDSDTGIETETVTSSVAAPVVIQSLYGIVLTNETSGTTTVNAYDAFGRIAATSRSIGDAALLPLQSFDYSPVGDLIAAHTYTNGADFVSESYAYDMLGNLVAATDALGNTIFKSYDPLCNVVAEWGATYPVRYTYDTQNRRTSLSTTRSATSNLQPFNLSTFQLAQWDTTAWTYDPRTGNCLSKTYADNSTVTYTHTPDNLLLRTTYASGRWIENVYDSRRQVVAVEYSNGEIAAFDYDAFLNEIAFSNDVASANLDCDARGNCTNDTAAVGYEVKTTRRTFDAFSRMTGIDGTIYEYSADGLLVLISNTTAVVDYAYTSDRLDAGYSLTLSNGVTFTRNLVRDSYRRSLVTGISSVANGVGVGSLAYTYDALNRPTARNTDTFGYNARSEVTAANVSGVPAAYGYDEIGNSTNWTANCLNQYTQFTHDADGNMTQCGDWTYTYDAANRLKTVSSNGVLLVTNFYDAKSRRVKKITQEATTTFFYDGWNLIEERIAYTNGTTTTIRYYWGKDLSGTLQGAAGVGGLLYLTVDGVVRVPFFDNNGNVTRYLDVNGDTMAQYTYDAFGNLIAKSGPLADFFRHRFSTKYYDTETGLCYYGYRFYHPPLMRWLNRDPIEEEGDVNLYGFLGNASLFFVDGLGDKAIRSWNAPRNYPRPPPPLPPVQISKRKESIPADGSIVDVLAALSSPSHSESYVIDLGKRVCQEQRPNYNVRSVLSMSRQPCFCCVVSYLHWSVGAERLYYFERANILHKRCSGARNDGAIASVPYPFTRTVLYFQWE